MYKLLVIVFMMSFLFACKTKKITETAYVPRQQTGFHPIKAPEWSKNANIYEVNIRQYSEAGDFKSFQKHLPRLKKMGVDILWLMPVFPIGEKERKGKLGSPYAVKDYKGINPDFGDYPDFKHLVEEAHKMGFKVILDWVANHSAFDNVWVKPHPDWYTQDEKGNIIHPKGTDWTDVADLNYDNKEMRAAMIDAMQYWVKTFDVDGFRCDVAGFVPNDFWQEAITALQKTKHLFMLAEWEDPKLHDAGFHMTYGWELHHIMDEIAKGEKTLSAIDSFILKDTKRFPPGAYRMNFTTNHDENSWNGTIKERFGDAGDAFTVLAFTLQGMPLVYSGQEAGLDKRLSFFDKDLIDWKDYRKQDFFRKLLKLKHENKALWNGEYGGSFKRLQTYNDEHIYAFLRQKGGDRVVVIINFSGKKEAFQFVGFSDNRLYTEIFSGEKKRLKRIKHTLWKMQPYSYLVFSYREPEQRN